MRKTLYIICVAALLSAVSACAPKATADGVEADGDTVEVSPSYMQTEHPQH